MVRKIQKGGVMTQDIIELAREAGLEATYPINHPMAKFIMAITARAEDKERKACEMACEEIKNKYSGLGDSAERVAVEWCLEAIRARGEQA
jgi:DNA-directed RNA polymerase subunit L